MRTLSNYITETIKIGKSASNISFYSCQPKDKDELKMIIEDRIKQEGPRCDLNDIDVTLIEDMSHLFTYSSFNGDISKWNVFNVKNMAVMFFGSKFNGNISRWNTSNVKNMSCMFYRSEFNGDISNWDVSNVKYMGSMFSWSKFNQDISNWKIREDCNTNKMFDRCPTREEYKPKSLQLI